METYLEISIIDSSKVRFFGSNFIEVLALSIAALENIEGLGPCFEKKVAEKVAEYSRHKQELVMVHETMA